MSKINLNPDARDELLDAAEDAVGALFDALEDGKVTPDEARLLVIALVAGAVAVPTPEPLEPTVVPLVTTALAQLWDKAEDSFRNEARLRRRIAEAEAKGKAEKVARLQLILAELLSEDSTET